MPRSATSESTQRESRSAEYPVLEDRVARVLRARGYKPTPVGKERRQQALVEEDRRGERDTNPPHHRCVVAEMTMLCSHAGASASLENSIWSVTPIQPWLISSWNEANCVPAGSCPAGLS